MYIDALSLREEQGTFILSLDASVDFIESGMPQHNMLEALLASPKAQTALDGSRYLVIPFKQGPGKGATNTPASTLGLVEAVKAEMKKRKIPLAGIERDDQGRPKLGKLHTFSVHGPMKTHEGPGQGWGPLGEPRQGPNERQKVGGGPGGGGTPFLAGVAVYQTAGEGGKVSKSVTTFRIASSKHEPPRWNHPGTPPAHIMDDTAKWAEEQVEHMLPQIIEAVTSKL